MIHTIRISVNRSFYQASYKILYQSAIHNLLRRAGNRAYSTTKPCLRRQLRMSAADIIAGDIQKAAVAIKEAKALVITAGAGMGVDSGLPDFRGNEGLWKAYPPLKKLGLSLPEMSTPRWFHTDPNFAWGFFGHRMQLYKSTTPHRGFEILKRWATSKESGYFVYTSNVDGHFQKAGFPEENIVECHGSIQFLQTLDGKGDVWPVPDDLVINVDESTFRASEPLPEGPPGIRILFDSFNLKNTYFLPSLKITGVLPSSGDSSAGARAPDPRRPRGQLPPLP